MLIVVLSATEQWSSTFAGATATAAALVVVAVHEEEHTGFLANTNIVWPPEKQKEKKNVSKII